MTAVERLVQSTLINRQADKLEKERQLEFSNQQGLMNYKTATSLLKKAIKKAQKTIELTIKKSTTLNKFFSQAEEHLSFMSGGSSRSYILTILKGRGNREGYELILSRNPYKVTLIHRQNLGDCGYSWFVDRAEEWDADHSQKYYNDGSNQLVFLTQTIEDLNSLTQDDKVVKIILDYFEKYPIKANQNC